MTKKIKWVASDIGWKRPIKKIRLCAYCLKETKDEDIDRITHFTHGPDFLVCKNCPKDKIWHENLREKQDEHID